MTSNRARRPFTAEEDKRLEELRNKKMSINDICLQMKRTRNSVESRLRKIGLTDSQEIRFKWNAEEDAFLEANATTLSLKEVAKALGRSTSATTKRASRLRTKSKTPLPQPTEKRDARSHGWDLRTQQEKSVFSRRMAAITAVEQAMNKFIQSKDQRNVHIS